MFIVRPMPKGYGAMLPQQAIVFKDNIRRIDTHVHGIAATCAIIERQTGT
jgi:hypothetical protein